MIDDAWAVLDAVDAEQAVLVGLCTGAGYVVLMAAEAPDRVLGVCAINPGLQLSPPLPHKVEFDFDAPRHVVRGLAEDEPALLARGLAGFRAVLLRARCSPSRTRPSSARTASAGRCRPTPEAMILAGYSPPYPGDEARTVAAVCEPVRCPVLVISGSLDRCQNPVAQLSARRAHRRRARDHRGRRPSAAGSRPGEGQPAAAGLRAARLLLTSAHPVRETLRTSRNPPRIAVATEGFRADRLFRAR